jgi:dTDP-4-amino-4,6-dideoxygalactose transaminase
VDIEPNFYTIDVERLEDAITAKTRAIIPVHLYGQAADMKSILALSKKHRIPVIEDCAQAHGAIYQGRPVGSWGDLSCFSFYPTKNLGALGDGGMILTSNPELAAKARLLREYGWEERYVSKIAGWNSRLDEMQAAILRVKLRYLDSDNGRRILLATKYDQALSGLRLITPKRRPAATHVYHLYVIRSSERDRLQAYLKERGVGALIHYPVPVHLQPAYRDLLQNTASLPVTEQVAREVLSLPIYPELSEHDLAKVVEIIHEYERGVFS